MRAALRRAGQVLHAQPLAWLPAVLIQAPLFWLWFAWIVSLGRLPARPATVDWIAAGAGLLALLAAQAVYAAGYLWLLDRLLREEQAEWCDLLQGARRLTVPMLAARWLQALAALLPAGLLLALLWLFYTGGSLDRWAEWARAGANGSLLGFVWGRRGAVWLTAVILGLAAVYAAETLRRRGAVWWRPAMVCEGVDPVEAARRALRFAAAQRAVLPRCGLARMAVWLAALLAPPVVSYPARFAAVWVEAPAGVVLDQAIQLLCWLTLAISLALASSYLTLADLIFYRLSGGADADPSLAVRGTRERRPRWSERPRAAADGWVIASEPSARVVWYPTVAPADDRPGL